MTFQEILVTRIAQLDKGAVPGPAQSFWGVLDRVIQYWLTAQEHAPVTKTLQTYVAQTTVAYKNGPFKTPTTEDGLGVLTIVSIEPVLGLLSSGLVVDVQTVGNVVTGTAYSYACTGGVYTVVGSDQEYGTELFQEDFTVLPPVSFLCQPRSGDIKPVSLITYATGIPTTVSVLGVNGSGWGDKDIPGVPAVHVCPFTAPTARALTVNGVSGEVAMKPGYPSQFGNTDWKSSVKLGIVLTWKGPPTRSFAIDKFMPMDGLTRQYSTVRMDFDDIPVYTCFWPELYYQGSVLVQAPSNYWMLGAGVKKLSSGTLLLIAVVFSRLPKTSGPGLDLELTVVTRPFGGSGYREFTDAKHTDGWTPVVTMSVDSVPTIPWFFDEDCTTAYSMNGDTVSLLAIFELGVAIGGTFSSVSASNTGFTRTQSSLSTSYQSPALKAPPEFITKNGYTFCSTYDRDSPAVAGLEDASSTEIGSSTYTSKTTGSKTIAADANGKLTSLVVAESETNTSSIKTVRYLSFAPVMHDAGSDSKLSLSGWDPDNPPGQVLSLNGGFVSCKPMEYSLVVSCGVWKHEVNTNVWIAEDLSDCACEDTITVSGTGSNDRGSLDYSFTWKRPVPPEPKELQVVCRKNNWSFTGGTSPYLVEQFAPEMNSWYPLGLNDPIQPCVTYQPCPGEPIMYRVSDARNRCKEDAEKTFLEFKSVTIANPPPEPLVVTGPAIYTQPSDYSATGGVKPYSWEYLPSCDLGQVIVHSCPRKESLGFWYTASTPAQTNGTWLSNNDRCCIPMSSVPPEIVKQVYCDASECYGGSIVTGAMKISYGANPAWVNNFYAVICNNCGANTNITRETFRWVCL